MLTTPLVSVIMATFNESPSLLDQAIGSILSQSFKDFELIIIDDSTNENSIEAINKIAKSDERIKIIREKERIGFVPALNRGLKLAKGEFIARMDGDDISMPDRFEKQVSFLEYHPEIDILGGEMTIINEKGENIGYREYKSNPFSLSAALRSPLAHPSVMIRKSSLKNNFYDINFKKAEDLEFWLRLRNQKLKFSNLKDPLIQYRVFEKMASKRSHNHFKYNLKARIKNFNLLYFFYDCIGITASFIYNILPNSIMNKLYQLKH